MANALPLTAPPNEGQVSPSGPNVSPDTQVLTQAFHVPPHQRSRKAAEKATADAGGRLGLDGGLVRLGSTRHGLMNAKEVPPPKLSMMNSYYAGQLIWVSITLFVVGLVAVLASQYEDFVQSVLKQNAVTQHSACMTVLPILGSMAVINVGLSFPAMGWQFATLYKLVHPASTTVLRLKFLYWCETMFLLQYIAGVVALISFVFYAIRLRMDYDGFNSMWGRIAWSVNALLVLLLAYQWVVFDRFRTHQKQQLGAPNELEHVGSWKFRRWVSGLMGKKAKTTSEFRADLYASVKRGKLLEVQTLLANALEGLNTDGERAMFFWKLYATPAMVLGLYANRTKNPLHIACQQGDAEMARVLLQAGLNPNFLDKMGGVDLGIGSVYQWLWRRHNRTKYVLVSPLHVAVSHGHLDCVDALREHEANMDIVAVTDVFSKDLAVPPLFYADSRVTAKALLGYGANHLMVPSFGTAMSTTVLQHNLFLDRVGLARLLEDHGCDYALTPLHALAAAGDVAAVQYYLRKGVEPDVLGEYYVGLNQRTPLHWAAVMGRTRVVETLLQHRATVDFMDRMGRTPLHWAARHNQVGVIKALLSYHASPTSLDDSNMTPLDVGAHSGSIREDAIRALLDRTSLNINRAYCGETPLHLALKQGHKDTALALVACGADIYEVNHDGRRAIDCCISAELQYSIKKASGSVDVYMSYEPPYYAFAKSVCDAIEANFISVNLRPVLETVPNKTLLKGVSVVLCVLSEGYGRHNLCMSELALAKQYSVPVVAVNCDCGPLSEELQVYLFTRQIIPFQRSVIQKAIDPLTSGLYAFTMDHDVFTQSLRSLLDGLRDEVELHRLGKRRNPHGMANGLAKTVLGTSSRYLHAATPSKHKPHSIFVSHGDCHPEFVQQLRFHLRQRGASVLVDSNSNVSGLKERVVAAKDAILQCQLFLVVLSAESILTSLVSDQLAFAEDKGKRIVPICLHSKLAGAGKLAGLFQNRLLVFADDLGFEHGMDSLVECLDEVSSSAPQDDAVAISKIQAELHAA
ncbi:hypothetical protein, variant 1 [Aphanomyces invadans]|uniref:TIR domain-containing protein n=1 Tax=Aphanomyces invadans TaxID=157072 RepID=A0A024UG24_9STRA|nr:hypothetical protein, variant 1 [Aphanomyces invadans]ETW04583.1 hypothetical protein, variant 1 [Aphanomyces invadans]|eukprot:XP_008866020.1 hypothetical protein, variant 1 [Aphanomyces invadans]